MAFCSRALKTSGHFWGRNVCRAKRGGVGGLQGYQFTAGLVASSLLSAVGEACWLCVIASLEIRKGVIDTKGLGSGGRVWPLPGDAVTPQ